MQTTKSHRKENVYIVVKILHNYNKNRKFLTCKMNKIWFILKIQLFLFYVFECFSVFIEVDHVYVEYLWRQAENLGYLGTGVTCGSEPPSRK